MSKFINPFASDIEKAKERKVRGQVAQMSKPEIVTLENPDLFFMGGSKSVELDSIFINKVEEAVDKANESGKGYMVVFYTMCRKTRFPMTANEIIYLVDRVGFKAGMVDLLIQRQGIERARFAEYGLSNPEMADYMQRYDALGEFGLEEPYDTTQFILDFIEQHRYELEAPINANVGSSQNNKTTPVADNSTDEAEKTVRRKKVEKTVGNRNIW